MTVRSGTGGPVIAAMLTAVLVAVLAAVLATIGAAAGIVGGRADAVPGAPPSETSTVPAADADAVHAAIDAINATAGGPVADQQQRLAQLTDPDRSAGLRCPVATTTVRFEPVYPGLRITGRQPGSTGYALPTLIRIYTGDRMTGTDLTALELVVRPAGDGAGAGNAAYLTPVCVN